MMSRSRWDNCVEHRGDEVLTFLANYFNIARRKVLFIAGAGFDPRATAIATHLAAHAKNVEALFIREERPEPSSELLALAVKNVHQLKGLFATCQVKNVNIFGPDNAVVGGRNIVEAVRGMSLNGVTDVIIDVSALSIGASYPLVRFFHERAARHEPRNLHVVVLPDAGLDESIVPEAGDVAGYVHGFKGGISLDSNANAARAWIPQLARGRNVALRRIYEFVQPHDTLAVLPFPSENLRNADELAEAYLEELEGSWNVDFRNVIYAAEDEPLDLYRTIVRIDRIRRSVFEQNGGSKLILTPMGSKVLALGALLAAMECDLPVAYLESIGYSLSAAPSRRQEGPDSRQFMHLWLDGEVYDTAPIVR